jgi:rare lipoprotein A
MRTSGIVRLSILAFALSCAAPYAFAQQHRAAPIVFAGQAREQGQGETVLASAAPGLAGGAENSYGYGGAAPRARSGAVIDIRRAPVAQERAAPPAEQGAQNTAWLERERVGPPYEANGRWYVPTPEPGYAETGMASWYGPQFHGQPTASGEAFDQEALTAAHPTLPIPSLVQVTNLENGREAIVRVNDRGPFVGERLIDLSRRSAEVLGFEAQGQARVHVRYLGPAPRRVNADGGDVQMSAAARAPAADNYAPAEGPLSLAPPPAAGASQTALPAPSSPPVGGSYYLQIGAFADLSTAHSVRANVAAAGPVGVDTRQTAAGELFRVRLGPFASAEEAAAARGTLAQLGYSDAILSGS